MKYISTRNVDLNLGFCDAILSGLSEDGGLYVPKEIPHFSEKYIKDLRGCSYQEIAFFIFRRFIGEEISSSKLQEIVHRAYSCFRNSAVTPLVKLNANEFLLELFHGPTLSFKDIAMQLLAELLEHILEERDRHITIVGATSGDTGAAAIKAFAGKKRISMYILFPKGKISLVQQRQMTTSKASNINVIAIEGSFDDCQKIVKSLFADVFFRDSVNLSGINSINWARIMAQIVYYFSSAVSLGSPDRKISFSVPTGNFGDIFAGYMAKIMGLPIERLIIATNENDTLVRMLDTGIYKPEKVKETTSPAMDIQISSNFERLLFEISKRNSLLVKEAFDSLESKKYFQIDPENLREISRVFYAKKSSMKDVDSVINSVLKQFNYLVDPHTAVGIHAAFACRKTISTPIVTLATAHPSKFPDFVKKASGIVPDCPISMEHIMERTESFIVMNKDIGKIKEFIKKKAEIEIEP
ncbi:threonine synthase [Candidatus Liberibacter africanus]|uniref:Threonine synthase n=1 Tax=Candidatus Liberibacter africanus PTSAPSY TaxID=1277257 RepID=A0A0G3I4L4_LIBAF|nr:threonine synthase [Candidatus Liberibacter africanus]AKK20190.1 threonine synthase [Candidatus Liberibacter africanus PTSAPSY]QTP63974.1 threonine synthase [Candidatus Liberibacter africanus]